MPQPFGMTTDCRHNTQLTQVAHTYTHRDRQATTPLKFHSPRPPFLASSSALATAAQAGKQKELKVQDEIVVHVSMLQCFLSPSPFYFSYSLSVVAATAGGAAIQASLGWSCCSGCACIPAGPGLAGLATFGMGMGMK